MWALTLLYSRSPPVSSQDGPVVPEADWDRVGHEGPVGPRGSRWTGKRSSTAWCVACSTTSSTGRPTWPKTSWRFRPPPTRPATISSSELDTLFSDAPLLFCLSGALPRPGSFWTVDLCGTPVLLTRDARRRRPRHGQRVPAPRRASGGRFGRRRGASPALSTPGCTTSRGTWSACRRPRGSRACAARTRASSSCR